MKLDQTWAVFFDAGHTLLAPRMPVGQVYADIARHYGVQADLVALDAGFRAAWKQLKIPANAAGPTRDEKSWWKRVVQKSWDHAGGGERLPFDDYFESVYRAFELPGMWRVYPDAWELLNWLRDHQITCGILSNWDERLRPVLKGHQLAEYFDSIIISGEVGVAKPAQEVFHIAEKSVSHDVKHFLLIGDDVDCDQVGAEQAGWHFYRVIRPNHGLDTIALNLEA